MIWLVVTLIAAMLYAAFIWCLFRIAAISGERMRKINENDKER